MNRRSARDDYRARLCRGQSKGFDTWFSLSSHIYCISVILLHYERLCYLIISQFAYIYSINKLTNASLAESAILHLPSSLYGGGSSLRLRAEAEIRDLKTHTELCLEV